MVSLKGCPVVKPFLLGFNAVAHHQDDMGTGFRLLKRVSGDMIRGKLRPNGPRQFIPVASITQCSSLLVCVEKSPCIFNLGWKKTVLHLARTDIKYKSHNAYAVIVRMYDFSKGYRNQTRSCAA